MLAIMLIPVQAQNMLFEKFSQELPLNLLSFTESLCSTTEPVLVFIMAKGVSERIEVDENF